MYIISVKIEGITPLLQNQSLDHPDGKFGDPWQDKLYITSEGEVYQPIEHIVDFLAAEAGDREDLIRAGVSFEETRLIHEGLDIPGEMDEDPEKPLYIDARPVRHNGVLTLCLRPAIKAGWTLGFNMIVHNKLTEGIIKDLLIAGKRRGIGDYTRRFGKFKLIEFEVSKK